MLIGVSRLQSIHRHIEGVSANPLSGPTSMSSPRPTRAPRAMSDIYKAIDPAELKAGGWEGIWKNGLQPGQVRGGDQSILPFRILHMLARQQCYGKCASVHKTALVKCYAHALLQKFDAARMSPITASKLASGEVSVEGKTCLVPGCG